MLDKESRKAVRGYSRRIGKLFGRISTPNQMTLITLILGLAAAAMVFYNQFLAAVLFFLLSGLSDWIDGAIAKATNRVTDFGGVLDSIVDKTTEIAIYIALAVVQPALAIPSMLAATMMMWSSYANQRCKAIGLEKGRGLMQRKERALLLIVVLLMLNFATAFVTVPILVAASCVLYLIAFLSFITGVQRVYLAYSKLGKGG